MITRIKNTVFSSNTYLLSNENDKHCLIIDPGLNELAIENKIQELDLKPIAIVCTHGHFDHIGGVSFFKEKYGIPFYLHYDDVKLMKSANFYLKLTKTDRLIKVGVPDVLFNKINTTLIIGGFELAISKFSGHTPGSCIIQYQNSIFTGDTIFREGLYLNKLPGENSVELRKSILEIFEIFDLNINCYPGHGKDATLDYIKTNNQDLIKFLNN